MRMKGAGQNLIEKIILLTISLLTGKICCKLRNQMLTIQGNIYLDKINMFLDTYASLKRINKYKLKFKSIP